MNRRLHRKARLLAGVAAGTLSVAWASALDFSFTQGGFAEGATISGSFSGEDADDNGILSHFRSDGLLELSAFNLSFSGNSIFDPFTMDLSNLEMFAFFLDSDSVLGNDVGPDLVMDPYAVEGIFAFDGPLSFAAGLGPLGSDGAMLFDDQTSAFEASEENARISGASSVPEGGATGAMLAASTLGLLFFRRRMAGRK